MGDYYEKNKIFKKIGVALSGGRDSLLTLLIAHRYASRINPENPGEILYVTDGDDQRMRVKALSRATGVQFALAGYGVVCLIVAGMMATRHRALRDELTRLYHRPGS